MTDLLQKLVITSVVLPLHIVEPFTNPIASSFLLAFWPMQLFLSMLGLYQNNFTSYPIFTARLADTIVSLFLIASIFLLEALAYSPNKNLTNYYSQSPSLAKELHQPNLISCLLFSWMNDMIISAYVNKTITSVDLPNAPTELSTMNSYHKLCQYYNPQKANLTTALARGFLNPFISLFLYEYAYICLEFVQPQLLKWLIKYCNNYDKEPTLKGYTISFLMFLITVVQTTINNQYEMKSIELSLACKSSLCAFIYRKSLQLSQHSRQMKTSGDIINLMSVDVNKVQQLALWLLNLITAPTELILCVVSLWSLVGKSTFAGIITMIIIMPFNYILIQRLKKLTKIQMTLKDSRTRIVNEICTTIKSIKLYAWEKPMLAKLMEARNVKELGNLKWIRLVYQASFLIWTTIPFLMTFATFAAFVVLNKDKPLTSEVVFPALSLLSLLSNPLTQLPESINVIIDASVSLLRINEFLCLPSLPELPLLPCAKSSGDVSVSIQNGSFYRSESNSARSTPCSTPTPVDEGSLLVTPKMVTTKSNHLTPLTATPVTSYSTLDDSRCALENISFVAHKGDFICVIGKVGSGKSTLLSAILGQLQSNNSNSNAQVFGTIAYCSQSPWIINASVKDNILFGHRYDQQYYDLTIAVAQLDPDLDILPDGDLTQVGEKGITLSGGQKARLSLARAIYSRADVYLLDDILSAVDSHVCNRIIEQVLSKSTGVLASKTVILLTNTVNVLKYLDDIYLLERGKIVEHSQYSGINDKDHPKMFDILTHNTGSSSKEESLTSSMVVQNVVEEAEEGEEVGDDDEPIENSDVASLATFVFDPLPKAPKNAKTVQEVEVSQKGKVKWTVYAQYIQACSYLGVIVWFAFLVCSQLSGILANYWLKHWTQEHGDFGDNSDAGRFLLVYGLLGILSSAFQFGRAGVLWVWVAIRASKEIHDKMAKRLMRAPMSYFESTPVGRILNRFTNDINKIDSEIPRVLSGFVTNIVKTLFTLAIVGIAMPKFLFIVGGLLFIYLYYLKYYVSISRELKRLVSVSSSPIYAHLQESLNGMETISAFRQFPRFDFINRSKVDFNLKCLFMQRSTNRWLSVRLQLIGSIVIFLAAVLTIRSLKTSNPLSGAMAGFVMSYALRVTSSLRSVVRLSATVESSIVAVERCAEYFLLPEEEPSEEEVEETGMKFIKPPIQWPMTGTIEFDLYCARYRANLDLVLKNISLSIKSGEKIGIVGRTGSGKSTLALAIFRIIEAVDGHINIDGLNTSLMKLFDLRHTLGIIPQDCQLFEGTIRQNLDPFSYYTDEEIWRAIETAHLKPHIENLRGEQNEEHEEQEQENKEIFDKLSIKVSEGGNNFSVGQRQLMALARVLLKMQRAKILVLDEATAAVDIQTDRIVQETLRKEFKDKTIITIAHRLETIMDSDKILALHQGEVVEFSTPSDLLKREDSAFYALCREAGLV
ncbi:uncharacterized protein KQ657_002316 [Scheffersomyces spartinae]|uniref:Uncharacterized protein n=1 Tax=Scheffersomyces spartinae TaxID=45513 RepID=A0A9P8AJZ2_9ASCO|nr:uncharacterized protein KQ657_002316 [Scheffersomyces spartinae]KAG7195930.1 hypothetical protein KQ657_002316 [Scheffersomyces spartinae]